MIIEKASVKEDILQALCSPLPCIYYLSKWFVISPSSPIPCKGPTVCVVCSIHAFVLKSQVEVKIISPGVFSLLFTSPRKRSFFPTPVGWIHNNGVKLDQHSALM